MLDRLYPTITELSQAIEREVEKFPEAKRLMTHPGVGALTALAFVLIIGQAERFQCGMQVASYLGLVRLKIPVGTGRLSHITKTGQFDDAFPAGGSGACDRAPCSRVAQQVSPLDDTEREARKLAVRLYRMMRQGWDYQQWSKFGSHSGQPGHRHGVQSNTEKFVEE